MNEYYDSTFRLKTNQNRKMPPPRVLGALDNARVGFYHIRGMIVAGMGMFSDSYAFFCMPPILNVLSRIYYEFEPPPKKFQMPLGVSSCIISAALLGTSIGQLVFGRLGDLKGRRGVYGLALMIMVISSVASGFSICRTRNCVLASLGFFRFFLGLGIGGDYPLSAVIMSEIANVRIRGGFVSAGFSMQGFGILASSVVTMVVVKIFEHSAHGLTANHTPEDADLAWRLILMMGAIPAGLTFYWRMLMPESARYRALVEYDVREAEREAGDAIEQVPGNHTNEGEEEEEAFPQSELPLYPLVSMKFLRRHGLDLFSCSVNWCLLDIVFYSSNLFQSQIYSQYLGLSRRNVYEQAFLIALFQFVVALCATIPGYFFSVFLIDRIGRRKIQIMGFFCTGLVYLSLGIPYSYWSKKTDGAFLFLYGLTFFFSNFGPNTTTFVVPAELFPARLRSTCHGIAGAVGKVGALIGTLGLLWTARTEDPVKESDDIHRMRAALVGLGGVCFLGVIFSYFFTRETMGRSLEDNEIDHPETATDLHALRGRGVHQQP